MYANQSIRESSAAGTTSITREAWVVLAIVTTFWIADGYDTFVLLVTGRPVLAELLPAEVSHAFARYLGYLVTITLAGWATGGVLGGIMGDRLGRRKTMLLGVALYSVATTASALTPTWQWLALARFLTGVGIGAEWGVGTSLLQEVWPEKWRTRGAGLLQAGFSVGGLLVSGLWILVGSTLGMSWRWMYLFGAVPLVIVVAVYRRIPESTRWTKARHEVNPLALFAQPQVRRHLVGALAVSISITGGWWAVTSFLPTFVASLAHTPREAASLAGWAGALYNFGEIVGCIAMGFLAEAWGRRPTTIVYLLGSLVIVPFVFAGLGSAQAVTIAQLVSGFFTGGLYSWYAIHTPELFPTRIRATAISVVFSGARYLAMAGAIAAGTLAAALGGFGKVALWFAPIYLLGVVAVWFLPETRGKGLPD
ncbi:MFS transporter [Paraburkholderia lycopersici]|uniref:Predicted arabinose efflux permease, MFS family n=1 Tax=Paraburkholderia lycopersici TaxID=416944 RepID=A0A1G6QCJ2_9BURK|nr:MFS transporter [Paraburkholderia lycopersici]SDC89397.1 Predicted arabinose efflux permease, MFS family [Paraburkholderia lycopersici]